MKDDLPYDAIPNFTAADALRVVGVGRNEYISTVVQAKSRKFMWVMNVKGVIKELLPSTPQSPRPAPWWIVNLVNLTEAEYRSINTPTLSHEANVCEAAARAGGVRYDAVDRSIVDSLYRRGLVWFEVPISLEDHISILTLEGFVSNKSTGVQNETDPLESLLYKVFVAASDGVAVGDLATILGVSTDYLLIAISIACRLEYCRKLDDVEEGLNEDFKEYSKQSPQLQASALGPGITISAAELEAVLSRHSIDAEVQINYDDKSASPTGRYISPSPGPSPSPLGKGELRDASSTRGIAVVVDAEVTGFLMMGALTPAVKKHAVTLFEGGRIHGNSVIDELMRELQLSTSMAADFEGEMAELGKTAEALAQILECVKRNAGNSNRPIELLRKESLEEPSIDSSAAFRILKHSYSILIPVTALSPPPLPIPPQVSLEGSGPTHYGPILAATSPWLNIALFQACCVSAGGNRIRAFAIPAATRIGAVQVLVNTGAPNSIVALWPWDPKVKRGGMSSQGPLLVKASTLLYTLNHLLTSCAVLVQPLTVQDDEYGDVTMDSEVIASSLVDIPLPLPLPVLPPDTVNGSTKASTALMLLLGYNRQDGSPVDVQLPSEWVIALCKDLGLEQSIGIFTVIRNPETPGDVISDVCWTPWSVKFGIPLSPVTLCSAVCRVAERNNFLDAEACKKHAQGQQVLFCKLRKLQSKFGSGPLDSCDDEDLDTFREASVDAIASPIHPLTIDAAGSVSVYDLGLAAQG